MTDLNFEDLAKAIQATTAKNCPPLLRRRFIQSIKEGEPLTSKEVNEQISYHKPAESKKREYNRLFYETGRTNPPDHWVRLGAKVKEIRLDSQVQQKKMSAVMGYGDNETQWRTEAGRRNLSIFELWAIACSLADLHDGCMLFDLRMREFWGQSLKSEIRRSSHGDVEWGWRNIHGAKTQVHLRQRLGETMTSARVLSGMTRQEVSQKFNVSPHSLADLELGRLDATVYLCWALAKSYRNYHYPSAVLDGALKRFLGADLSELVDEMLVIKKEQPDSLSTSASSS